jgi:XTP/dITP diphosphohydrolase
LLNFATEKLQKETECMRVLIASSNKGKLRDFVAVASLHGVEVDLIPNFASLPIAVEDGETFEENARKKAEHYSRYVPGELVLADDSGLAVDGLGGAPGVRSARYAAAGDEECGNSDDAANNAKVLREMNDVADANRTARFVCVIAVARDGKTVATFDGKAEGLLLRELKGGGGFGYDPMFYFPELGKTFAELSSTEKAAVSHRGQAFGRFMEWCDRQS